MIKWEVRRLFNEMVGVSISCYEITISRRNRKHSELKIPTKRNNMERYKMENRQAIKLSFEFRFSGLTMTPGLMRMPEHSECKYTSARWSMFASIRSLFRFGKQTRSYTTIKSSRQMLKRCPRYVPTSRSVALHEPNSIDLSISSLSNRLWCAVTKGQRKKCRISLYFTLIMDDPLFLINGRRIGKESCPNLNDHSNYPPTVLRSCNRIKSFIRLFEKRMLLARWLSSVIRTREQTQRDVQFRENALNVPRRIFSTIGNVWNDTKNTRAQIYKIYQRTATSCSLCHLNEQIISSSLLY